MKHAGKRISTRRRYLLRPVVVSILLAFTVSARADGGSALWQRTAGPVTVTAFTTEPPVRTGQVDLSFLLENSAPSSKPILDARVLVTLENETGTTLRAEATHAQARNKLLYCSLINLPEAGHWIMKISIEYGDERAEVRDHLMVANAQPMLLAHWKVLAFPPLMIIIFIINQWLRGKTSQR